MLSNYYNNKFVQLSSCKQTGLGAAMAMNKDNELGGLEVHWRFD